MTGMDWVTQRERESLREGIDPHEFKAGYSGVSCSQLVMRNGAGEDCGLPANDIVHNESIIRMVQETQSSKAHVENPPMGSGSIQFVPLRSDLLQEAEGIVNGDRQATYGDARSSFQRIADLWTAYLGLDGPLTANQAAVMLALLKVSRAASSPGHRDSYVDMAGYAALAGELGIDDEKRER